MGVLLESRFPSSSKNQRYFRKYLSKISYEPSESKRKGAPGLSQQPNKKTRGAPTPGFGGVYTPPSRREGGPTRGTPFRGRGRGYRGRGKRGY
jgi:hypothetical protein